MVSMRSYGRKSWQTGYHSLNMHISDILPGYARIYLILTEGMPFFLITHELEYRDAGIRHLMGERSLK